MNPISGVIKAHSIGELILDKTKINPSETKIVITNPPIKSQTNIREYMLLEEEKMKNQFSKLTNRWNSGSLKWEIKENELPMWVADMDF